MVFVSKIVAAGASYEVTGSGYDPAGQIVPQKDEPSIALVECLTAGLLCNDSQLVEMDGRWTVQGDPTEGALIVAARKAGLDPDLVVYPARLDAIPFDSQHQYMATLHADGMVYVKGAAEVLLDRCKGGSCAGPHRAAGGHGTLHVRPHGTVDMPRDRDVCELTKKHAQHTFVLKLIRFL